MREEIKELNNNNNNKNNKSSYDQGVMGEKKLLDVLREESDFLVKDTHGANHMGDAEVIYSDMRFCIDAKQYKTTCPHKESTKLVDDVEKNSYDGGILISWDSGIYDPQTSSKIKDLLFYKTFNGKPYLFISNANSIPEKLIISAIKELSTNKLTNESLNTIQINDKLSEELSKMIYSELKEIDASDKKLKIKERRNNERRKELHSLAKEYKLTNNSLKSSNNDIITDICSHLQEIKQEYKAQRNSTRDIKVYIEQYCDKYEITYHKFTDGDVKKALIELCIESGNKTGKNYQGKQRKSSNSTWAIELSLELL